MASDWISALKEPNMCSQRFSCLWLCLFASRSFESGKNPGTQCKKKMFKSIHYDIDNTIF